MTKRGIEGTHDLIQHALSCIQHDLTAYDVTDVRIFGSRIVTYGGDGKATGVYSLGATSYGRETGKRIADLWETTADGGSRELMRIRQRRTHGHTG